MADETPQSRRERQVAFLRGLYERHLARLRDARGEAPPALAQRVHGEIDAVIERDRGADPRSTAIRCSSGCSHCCSGPVEIWAQEAALLVEHVRTAGLLLDVARLERQSRHDVDRWRDQPVADRACVFLGSDGACRVYAVRPNACRKLLVTSDPQHCDIPRGEYEHIERWFSWEAEMIETAALETFGMVMMPLAVLEALRDAEAAGGGG